jgi:hypothetical protein
MTFVEAREWIKEESSAFVHKVLEAKGYLEGREDAIKECAEIATQQSCNNRCNVLIIEKSIRSLLEQKP